MEAPYLKLKALYNLSYYYLPTCPPPPPTVHKVQRHPTPDMQNKCIRTPHTTTYTQHNSYLPAWCKQHLEVHPLQVGHVKRATDRSTQLPNRKQKIATENPLLGFIKPVKNVHLRFLKNGFYSSKILISGIRSLWQILILYLF